jgi:hypothetical protein
MSFLEPILLTALPLVALPILIHLINQRRYQTTRWAAMMFLLAAHRMSRGYARLRQWLILAARMLAIAGLIFAVSRPLASGWLGLTMGGRIDTTIVLLDRSPSMQQRSPGAGVSKLQTARQQLAQTLAMLGSSRWVLIESTTNKPRELESPAAMLDLPCTEPTSTEADLPAMLEAALGYVRANRTGRTEIWICSDLRENDWHADDGRWQTLRAGFLEMTQEVRIHLLAYPQTTPDNVTVRVTNVRRRQSGQEAELLVSLLLFREGESHDKRKIPVQFQINGSRSEVMIDMVGPQYELKDHRIALKSGREPGWGRISIPEDANPADNEFFFVFDDPPPRKTILVADDPQAAWPLKLAAASSPDPMVACHAEVVPIAQVATVPWEQVSLVLWQAPLPQGDAAKSVQSFVEQGGQVIFLPPRAPGEEQLFGVRWQSWVAPGEDIPVETWRGDQDLFAHVLSGEALPVGELHVRKYCKLAGEAAALATLRGGAPLVARVATNHGGVYFWATTPAPADSSLAADGVVLYVALQRALAAGSEGLGNTRSLVAGRVPAGIPTTWKRLAGTDQALSTDYAFHQGVYTAGERLLAVHRAAAEDRAAVLDQSRAAGLFRGLDFARVDDLAGNANSLIQEIWRVFLAMMIVAMVGEAGLCLSRQRPAQGTTT